MSRKTAKQTPTTTTTWAPVGASGGISFTGGSLSQSPILYPDANTIYNTLVRSGANASAARALANKLGGKPILSGGYTDSNGNINKAGFFALMSEINKQGGEALAEAVFGKVPGLNIGEYFQGTKGADSVAAGAVRALNDAGTQYGGELTKLPVDVNYGPGLSATDLDRQQVLNEAVTISGQQIQAITAGNAAASTKVGAYETLTTTLNNYDLASLAPQVYNWVFNNGITNPKELMNLVRSTDQYKQQFAGLIEQQKNAVAMGSKPLTEAGYMALTQSYLNTAQTAGVPTEMLTQVDPKTKRTVLADLVAGNVSAAEFSRRVSLGYQAVESLPQSVKDSFMQQHGLGQSDLVAYFLDPEKGMQAITNKKNASALNQAMLDQANQQAIQRQREALGANLGYNAQSAGLQNFTPGQAMDLGEMVRVAGFGNANDPYSTFTLGQAQKALQTASKDVALTGSAPGGTAPTVDTATLIGAQVAGYEGTNLQAAQSTALKAAQAAAAPYEKGGGYAETAKGVTGVGSGSI